MQFAASFHCFLMLVDPPEPNVLPPLQRMQGWDFPRKVGEPERWELTRISGSGLPVSKGWRSRAKEGKGKGATTKLYRSIPRGARSR
jgi:hypothetical protein